MRIFTALWNQLLRTLFRYFDSEEACDFENSMAKYTDVNRLDNTGINRLIEVLPKNETTHKWIGTCKRCSKMIGFYKTLFASLNTTKAIKLAKHGALSGKTGFAVSQNSGEQYFIGFKIKPWFSELKYLLVQEGDKYSAMELTSTTVNKEEVIFLGDEKMTLRKLFDDYPDWELDFFDQKKLRAKIPALFSN